MNQQPSKASTLKSLRLPNDVVKKINERAAIENRSFNNMVATILKESVA